MQNRTSAGTAPEVQKATVATKVTMATAALMALLSVLALLTSLPALAAPPTDESIERLLVVMRSPRQIDSVIKIFEGSFNQGLDAQFKGKELNADQQHFLDRVRAHVMDEIHQELAWDRMKPLMIQVYREQLSQEEVDGITAFYASPVGQSVVDKMPGIMQASSTLMQKRMKGMQERLQRELEDAAQDLKHQGGS